MTPQTTISLALRLQRKGRFSDGQDLPPPATDAPPPMRQGRSHHLRHRMVIRNLPGRTMCCNSTTDLASAIVPHVPLATDPSTVQSSPASPATVVVTAAAQLDTAKGRHRSYRGQVPSPFIRLPQTTPPANEMLQFNVEGRRRASSWASLEAPLRAPCPSGRYPSAHPRCAWRPPPLPVHLLGSTCPWTPLGSREAQLRARREWRSSMPKQQVEEKHARASRLGGPKSARAVSKASEDPMKEDGKGGSISSSSCSAYMPFSLPSFPLLRDPPTLPFLLEERW